MVGAGATGGFFGAHLARAGRDVTFLVRPGRAAQLRERGLRITGLGPDVVLDPRLVTAAEVDRPYDLVLLAVKAAGLPSALDDLATAVGPGTVIVPFLNGLAHLDVLNARFGEERVLGGVARVMTMVDDQGDIVRLGPIADLAIGEQNARPSDRLKAIEAELTCAGFGIAVSSDIIRAMWHKWVFISTLGALTTLMRGSVGEVVAVPGGDRLAPRILAEAAAVSAAAGYPMSEGGIAAVTALLTEAGSTDTASIYRDLVAGRPVEVEQIFGDLLDRARALGVATPLLDLSTMGLRVHENRRVRQRQKSSAAETGS
ncbi:2-dehydropantoate 2-reductase [Actinoplanes regularis]|nr:2-dehydropantoate 2-reductase [Actinoplanes regularis]